MRERDSGASTLSFFPLSLSFRLLPLSGVSLRQQSKRGERGGVAEWDGVSVLLWAIHPMRQTIYATSVVLRRWLVGGAELGLRRLTHRRPALTERHLL